MKNKSELITEACSSYKRGMSLKNVKDHLSEYRETDVSRTSILSWVRKYSVLLAKKTERFTPKIKGPLHNDEFFVHVKKN
jgi:transposase-like protein